MTIDPRVGFWLSFIAAVISGIVGAAAEFTNVFGAENAHKIIGVLIIANVILNAINSALHAIPSPPQNYSGARGSRGKRMFYLGPNNPKGR